MRVTKSLWRDQRGVALPLALMALVSLGGLAAALLAIGSSEVLIATNHQQTVQTLFLAEAGVEDAFNVFRNTPNLVTNAPASLTAVPGLAGPGAALTPLGGYTVQYQRAGTNTVLVVAAGTTGIGGTQRVLRVTMTTAWIPDVAWLTNGNFTISGDGTVNGACGSAHANGNLSISGDPIFSGSLTASGTYSGGGGATIGGESGGGRPTVLTPTIDPADVLATAKSTLPANQVFQLMSDGRVLNGADTLITNLNNNQSYNGWIFQQGSPGGFRWKRTSDVANDGTYYFQGSVELRGSPGAPGNPWRTTLISTESIAVLGDPIIAGHLPDTLLIAGGDIKISGDPAQSFTGLIAAHEQVWVSGDPVLNAAIVAENAASTNSLVTVSTISGGGPGLVLTYNCGLRPSLKIPLAILSWGV